MKARAFSLLLALVLCGVRISSFSSSSSLPLVSPPSCRCFIPLLAMRGGAEQATTEMTEEEMEAEIDDDLAVNRFKRQFYQEPKPIFMSEKEKERIGKLHDEELAKLDDNVQRYEAWKEKKRKRNEWNKVHIRYHKNKTLSLAVDHEDDDETLNKPDSVDDSEFASSKSWAEMMEGTQRRWNIVDDMEPVYEHIVDPVERELTKKAFDRERARIRIDKYERLQKRLKDPTNPDDLMRSLGIKSTSYAVDEGVYFDPRKEELETMNKVGIAREGSIRVTYSNATQQQIKFWLSARSGNISAMARYLEAGGDIDYADQEQNTALHMACARGHTMAVKFLLDAGANVHHRNDWQATPLHTASEWGRHDIVELLVEYGADLEARDELKMTPLLLAIQLPNRDDILGNGDPLKTVETLVKLGSKMFVIDCYGNIPRDYVSDFQPYCVQKAARQFLPPETLEEMNYCKKRGPPIGAVVPNQTEFSSPTSSLSINSSFSVGSSSISSHSSSSCLSVPPDVAQDYLAEFTPSDSEEGAKVDIDRMGYEAQREIGEMSSSLVSNHSSDAILGDSGKSDIPDEEEGEGARRRRLEGEDVEGSMEDGEETEVEEEKIFKGFNKLDVKYFKEEAAATGNVGPRKGAKGQDSRRMGEKDEDDDDDEEEEEEEEDEEEVYRDFLESHQNVRDVPRQRRDRRKSRLPTGGHTLPDLFGKDHLDQMAQRAEVELRKLRTGGRVRVPVNRTQGKVELGGWNVEDETLFMEGMSKMQNFDSFL